MSRLFAILLALLCAARAQTSTEFFSCRGAIWSPPTLAMPGEIPPSTVPKELITTMHVADLQITLEETKLQDVKKRLGGIIGKEGYLNAPLEWLCFHGTDTKGKWILWLMSDYMGQGTVNGLAMERLGQDATPDQRCQLRDVAIDWPLGIGVGIAEKQVRETLGKPTFEYHGTLVFDHEHEINIRNEQCGVSNSVAVAIRNGFVWTIQVWRSTTC